MSTTEQHRKWRENNKDRVNINSIKSKERHFAAYILKRCRDSAKKRGIPFDLSKRWIQEKLDSGLCEVSGLPFDFRIGTGGRRGKRNPYGPSIDRQDSDKGYIEENCQMVVWMLNAAKGSWTIEDVMYLARALVSKEKRSK